MTQQQYYYATGKRKSSIAKIRLYPGKGSITVNGKPMVESIPWQTWQKMIEEPFKVTDTTKSFDVIASVKGGGVASPPSWASQIEGNHSMYIRSSCLVSNPNDSVCAVRHEQSK